MRVSGVAMLGCLALVVAAVAPSVMASEARFWVVGSFTRGCWIVEKNPIIDGGTIQFSDGPYGSKDDAKLAMTTIRVCNA